MHTAIAAVSINGNLSKNSIKQQHVIPWKEGRRRMARRNRWRSLMSILPKWLMSDAKKADVLTMTITQIEFGGRLKAARSLESMEIAQVASTLGYTVGEVERIEAGLRRISSREFERFVGLYGKEHAWYVDPDPIDMKPRLSARRSVMGRADRKEIDAALRKCFAIYDQMVSIKRMCGVTPSTIPRYAMGMAASEAEAIAQGRAAARTERERMGLASAPIDDLPELLAAHGVEVGLVNLPADISGMMLAQEGEDPFVVANETEHVLRRNFSFAHEYAHVLFDREDAGIVSRQSEEKTSRERRANAFAASFLLPDEGVVAYLETVGKNRRKRFFVGNGDIDEADVIALATRFRVSGHVAALKLHHLGALKDQGRVEALVKATAGRIVLAGFDHAKARETFKRRYASLAERAYREWQISEGKFVEILAMAFGQHEAEKRLKALMEQLEIVEGIDALGDRA